jgi:LPXTG-motif cell wall-anchored protein
MGIEQQDLWLALAAMRIEPEGAALSFEARLAREEGWTAKKTVRVMREYRRFLYLAAAGNRPVTPSDAVDAAWHLHLTYTRHYWGELCGRILGRALHHEPTEGGVAEAAHFRGQYRATLEAYRAAFGEAPPADIWPVAGLANEALRIRRSLLARLAPLAAAAAGTSLIAACTALAAAADVEDEGVTIEGVIGLAIIAGIIFLFVRRRKRRGADRGGKAMRRGRDGGGAYAASDSNDNDRSDSDGGSDGGSGCGSSCGGGGD